MRPSIAKTLYYRLTWSLFVLWLSVVLAVAAVLQYEAEEVFDSNLQETAQRILSLSVREIQLAKTDQASSATEPAEHEEYLTYQIFNRQGEMLMRSHIASPTPFPAPLKAGFYQQDSQQFYVDATKNGDYWIKLAERRDHRESTLRDTLQRLLLPLLALLPLAILLIRQSISHVRQSINELDHELSSRDSKDLRPINTVALPSELLGLAEATNSLMERLKGALEAERNFAANSAHELRTPIASALAQLDVLRDELADPNARLRLASARHMIERLEQMATKLLQLARAEAGMAFNTTPINLRPLLEMLIRDLSFRSTRPVVLTCPANPAPILGDIDAVGIVVQNLLENADRYGTPGNPMQIELTANGSLTIRNDCPALPEQLLSSLRKRFVRGDQSQSGSGIGLSIVDTILGQCGAELRLESPCYDNGRGFSAHVSFNYRER